MSKKSKSNSKPRTVLNVPLKKPTPGDVEAAKMATTGEAKRPDVAMSEKIAADIAAQAQQAANFQVHPFPDKSFLQWAHNPRKQGTFVIFDGANTPLAVTNHPAAADLMCHGVNFMLAYQQAEAERKGKMADAMVDGLLPDAMGEPAPTGETIPPNTPEPMPTVGDLPNTQPTNIISMERDNGKA